MEEGAVLGGGETGDTLQSKHQASGTNVENWKTTGETLPVIQEGALAPGGSPVLTSSQMHGVLGRGLSWDVRREGVWGSLFPGERASSLSLAIEPFSLADRAGGRGNASHRRALPVSCEATALK